MRRMPKRLAARRWWARRVLHAYKRSRPPGKPDSVVA